MKSWDLDAQTAPPSEQVEEMAVQGKGRKTARKTRVCEPKTSDKGKSVHRTSEWGAKNVVPERECGDSENITVFRYQFRLDHFGKKC